jgi:THAP4-like, heme-binding beta-barrel domain
VRSGPPIHDALFALLPLVGEWTGEGAGISPAGDGFTFGQTLRFAHDGRPFLAYESRAWLMGDHGAVIRQAWRESGFWRPGSDQDALEVVLASNTGQALVYAGVAGDQRWEIATASADHTATAKTVDAERRLYALVNGDLMYASELAVRGGGLAPHLNARLARRPTSSDR